MLNLKRSIDMFENIALKQEAKGIEKYGQRLNPLDRYDWLRMAAEEQVDGFKYLHAEIEKRRFAIGMIKGILSELDLDTLKKVEPYLKLLEGGKHETSD